MAGEGGAREAILSRIRRANGAAAEVGRIDAEWEGISRAYRQETTLDRGSMIELLEDRLRDYDAQTSRATRAEVAGEIERRLRERKGPRMIAPRGFPEEMLPRGASITMDDGFSAAELDGFDGVLTTATMAIAQTGTLVLQNVAGQGRRAVSLVPDYHLCVLSMGDVVQSVPEAMERLRRTATLATTFISGPSATADIEMTRIKGVHGPRFLHVILVSD